jgi:hypothetical protein
MPFDGQTRYQIDITAADRTAQAFATVDRRLKAMEVTQRAVSSGLNAGFALVTRTLAPLAAALSAAAVAQRVWQAGMEAANLGEQAEQIGLTTDALQAYRLAAAQNGVEAGQLDTAFMRLTKSMGEAAGGSDDAIARFEKLGVSLLDNNGNLRRTSNILPEVARGLLEIGNQAQRDALMMELFGRSGARMVTMLEAFSGGQAKLTAEARELAAIMGVDVIAAWDKVDDRLKVVNQQMTVFQATVGAPLALGGLNALEWTLRQIADGYRGAKNAAIDFGLAIGTTVRGFNVKQLESDVAQLEKRIANPSYLDRGGLPTMKQQLAEKKALLDKAKADEADYVRGAQENLLGRQLMLPMEPPPVTFRDFGLKGKQPTGKTAAAAGAKLDDRLKDLQAERAALEKALAAFDVRGLESVAEVDKRLDAQVKLDQKIASLLKDVPPNSALSQQLIQEATSVAQLNQRLDERKRLLTEAEQVATQFGDGSRAAARATADLNAMLAAGAIDADTYARALRATKDAAADQERTARGAMGGFDGFRAGMEQYGAEMQKANSAFEMGKFTAQEFGSVFSGLNQGLREGKDLWTALGDSATTALGRIADKLIEMAAQDLFAAAFGGSGGGGGGSGLGGLIGGLFGGGSSGTAPGLFEGLMGASFFPTFADGGNYQAGVPRIVGEKGWELDVPRTGGTIYNQRQLASLLRGGGGESRQPVVVHVHANEGFVTATAEGAALRIVNRATPGIVKESVKKSGEQAPAVMARHEAQRGGEWR